MDGFELKLVVGALATPPALPLLFVLSGLLFAALSGPARHQPARSGRTGARARLWRRLGLSLAGIGLALAYLSSIGATADLLGDWLEQGQERWEPASTTAAGTQPQAVVVLGGGAVRDGVAGRHRERLTESTLQRVVEGGRVARGTGLPVLVSGGTPQGLTRPEAHVMRDVLQQMLGVSARWVEDRSRDTADNARMSAAILREAGVSRVILVTHAYHMPRARMAFEAEGLVVTPAPHDFFGDSWQSWQARDFLPRAQDAQQVALCLHEALGRLWYRWRGFI